MRTIEKMPIGKDAYEKQLLISLEIELTRFLEETEKSAYEKRRALAYFRHHISKENIIKIHTHSIRRIHKHLLNNTIHELTCFTESHFNTSILDKPRMIRTKYPKS